VLAISLLVVAVVGAAAVATAVVLDRATREDLRADLTGAERVFAEAWSYRRAALRSEARVVAEEPRLKAVTSAEDVERDTIVGVALELHQAVGSDLFVLVDASGRLILDAADPEQSGHDLKSHEVIREALAKGDASGVWTSGQAVYQVQARRLEFGETPFGVLVVGYALGAKLVDSLERQLGARAILELDGNAVAVSDATGAGGFDRESLRGALSTLPSGGVHELNVGGTRYLGVAGALPGYSGQRKLRYGLLRSLDEALAPSLRLRALLSWIAACALLVAIVCAGLLSRNLSRPLEALVGLTRDFAKGELSARVEPTGPREMRILAGSLNQMAADLERTQRSLRQKDRLERELEIAERIQTALLPHVTQVGRLEIAARMVPATNVGGDYYDIHPTTDGAWIGVGDVAGHGLTAGLIMLMVQSATASLVRGMPDAPPSRLVNLLNEIVYTNVNERLGESDHVTFALLRYYHDGRIVHAGAHEDMIVYRSQEKRCEIFRARGMWLGVVPSIAHASADEEIRLERGDILVLYSDGIIEAIDDAHEMYGIQRLMAKITELAGEPVATICHSIFEDVNTHASVQEDDRTLLVARQA
jgi:serine phosphatase RsbU (regulator of sigma subunit)